MNATYSITYNPRRAIPAEPRQRAAWLDKHGLLPDTATLSITLPLTRWAELGADIDDAGGVSFMLPLRWDYPRLNDNDAPGGGFIGAAFKLVRETGKVVETLPPEIVEVVCRDHLASLTAWNQARLNKAAEEDVRRKMHLDKVRARLKALLEGPEEDLIEAAEVAGTIIYRTRPVVLVDMPADIHDLNSKLDDRARRAASAAVARDAAEITAWVNTHGTESQRERFAEGLLPEEELWHGIREWIFASFEGTTRYARIDTRQIRHRDDCDGCHEIHCDTVPADANGLTPAAYDRLKHLRSLAAACPAPVVVEALEHYCECEGCEAVISRNSGKARAVFGGRILTREYALSEK